MKLNKRYLTSLIARAKNQEIENFTDEEIERVFKNTAHETRNIKNFKELVRRGNMIKFKCKECGKLQYSSNIEIAPCIKCGGKIEVWELEEEENEK